MFEEPQLVGDAGAADVDGDVPDAPHPNLRQQPRPGQTCKQCLTMLCNALRVHLLLF